MMSTIPIWQHVLTVLALIAIQVGTGMHALKVIRDLRAALVAKRVLLGAGGMFQKTQFLAAGDTLTLEDGNGNTLSIESTNATTIHVKAHPAP